MCTCARADVHFSRVLLSAVRHLATYKISTQSVQWFSRYKKGVRTCALAAVGHILVARYNRLYGTWQHTKFQTNRSSGS